MEHEHGKKSQKKCSEVNKHILKGQYVISAPQCHKDKGQFSKVNECFSPTTTSDLEFKLNLHVLSHFYEITECQLTDDIKGTSTLS